MTTVGRHVIGLGGSNHDLSAALVTDWDLTVAVEQERLTRRKHGAAFWFQNPVQRSIDYCLDAANLSPNDISEFVSSDLLPARAMTTESGRSVRTYPHHLCHAASVALMVPLDSRAVVLVADGMGGITQPRESDDHSNIRETFSFFQYREGELTRLGGTVGESLFEHDDYPSGCTNSIGKFYEVVTHSLGFEAMQEGKTMGLAAFGSPRFMPMLREFFTLGNDLDACFSCDPIGSGLVDAIERALFTERGSFDCRADMAASAQKVFEDVLLHAQSMVLQQDTDMFLFAGGCALNTVCNGRLSGALDGKASFLAPPHSSDAGVGLGAAWLAQRDHFGKAQPFTVRGDEPTLHIGRLGVNYDAASIKQSVNAAYPRLASDLGHSSAEGIAQLLKDGKVIGFFEGRSEFGPRALGGRSLLCDPGSATARERINRDIKYREPFRPLAPIVPEDCFANYFEPADAMDRFMLRVANAKPDTRKLAPAAVHVDGTARVQAVSKAVAPLLHAVLTEFGRLSGYPILINTSFNGRGEPIVETPDDAISAYFSLGLDALVLDGQVYFSP